EGAYFLVMEYLHGEPLTSALARRDMTPNEVLELLLPAMRGVAAAHRQGVVHRDLKPDNIFLAYEEDGVRRQPKVLDFGISKLSSDGTVDMRLTKTGAVVGTPYYMSPEQIRGLAGLDKRADVYSIGVILYEALTGRVPFHADTYGALVLEIATGTAQKPSDLVPGLPSGLSAIVLRAMAREADARYPDMESLIRALEPYALPQAIRSERRDSTGSGLRLEATRIAPPRIAPPRSESSGFGASLPRVTSTPFSAEIPEPARGFARLTGPVLFVVAAIAVVAGVWYMTREPAIAPSQAAAPPVPIETRPVPPPTAAAAVAPIAPTPSLVPPPSAASATPLPPATNSTPPPTAADGVSAPAAKPSPSAPARESNLDVSHAKATAHKRPVRNGSAKPASDPPDSPPSPATRARTPRSGTLNVDEF
ncbi:MAG TPA: protein kinase, partial [Polyangiales bacterium]